MLTNHTDNSQQENIPKYSHKHAHMSLLQQHSLVPVRRAVHCKQKN